jgi:hypothetical protein
VGAQTGRPSFGLDEVAEFGDLNASLDREQPFLPLRIVRYQIRHLTNDAGSDDQMDKL